MKHDNHTKAYLEQLKSMKLDPGVRARMWADLEKYAEFHSATTADVRAHEQRRLNGVAGFPARTLFNAKYFKVMKASLLITLMMLGGGTSFAAAGTLPGDLLYPVKVHINERIQSAFAIGADSETRLQVALLEERLHEAAELASRGALEGDAAVAVKTGIETQTQRAIAVSLNSTVDTQADARLALDAALQEFGTKLASLDSDLGMSIVAEVKSDLSRTLAQAESRGESVDQSTAEEAEDMETSTMTLRADDSSAFSLEMGSEMGKLAGVDVLIAQLTASIKGIKAAFDDAFDINADAKAEIKANITIAEDSLNEAQTQFEAGNETEARTALDRGLEHVGKAEAALSLLGNLIFDSETGGVIGFEPFGEMDGQGSAGFEGDATLEGDMIEAPLSGEGGADLEIGL